MVALMVTIRIPLGNGALYTLSDFATDRLSPMKLGFDRFDRRGREPIVMYREAEAMLPRCSGVSRGSALGMPDIIRFWFNLSASYDCTSHSEKICHSVRWINPSSTLPLDGHWRLLLSFFSPICDEHGNPCWGVWVTCEHERTRTRLATELRSPLCQFATRRKRRARPERRTANGKTRTNERNQFHLICQPQAGDLLLRDKFFNQCHVF